MGTSKAPIDSTSHLQKIRPLSKKTSNSNDSLLLKTESAFIRAYNQDPKQAYKTYLSDQSILNREQMDYATQPADQATMIASFSNQITFIPLKAGIASSRDLGYVYGKLFTMTRNKTTCTFGGMNKKGGK